MVKVCLSILDGTSLVARLEWGGSREGAGGNVVLGAGEGREKWVKKIGAVEV